MIAHNLLEINQTYLQAYPNAKRRYKVHVYKNVLYIETGDKTLPYYILERTDKKEGDIEYGNLYIYFKIDNDIYSSFLTNDYKEFATDNQQLTIFDLY